MTYNDNDLDLNMCAPSGYKYNNVPQRTWLKYLDLLYQLKAQYVVFFATRGRGFQQ